MFNRKSYKEKRRKHLRKEVKKMKIKVVTSRGDVYEFEDHKLLILEPRRLVIKKDDKEYHYDSVFLVEVEI